VAVQVWIGEKPEHPQERRAIVALASALERLEGLYLILANFSVGGRNIDLVVLKPDGIFIIELKYCDGKIYGDVNGPWFVEGSNGERKRLNPGRKNPYNQVISYYYSLVNFLNDNRPRFLSPQKAADLDFRTCRRLVVIAPVIQEGSQVETDWKVDLKGLDELPTYLVTERSSEINLSEEEMQAIPELLHCTPWGEVSALVSGSLTQIEAAPAPQPTAAAPEPEPAPPVAAPEPAARPRLRDWLLGTRAGRWASAAAGAAALAAVALSFTMRPASGVSADQPAPMTASTSLPAGGADASQISAAPECVWVGFQPVGRRYAIASDTWETVGAVSTAQDLAPDVVVTLEEVSFCDGQIAITWSVRNNTGDAAVSLPLTSENIVVRDSFGNIYPIAEGGEVQSVLAEPGGRGRGTAIVDQPVNLGSPTLLIQLTDQPFGEATWLVPIQQS
jgi:Nuclease-related domain